jgi:lipopolysaccharide transport system permease protein
MLLMLRALWLYRHFIVGSIVNDLRARFGRSKLGGAWMVINPLSQVAIYALILSNVLAAKLPGIENKYAYAIYLMAGLLAWTLFDEIVNRSLNIFVAQGNVMKKISFPRITLPVIVVGSSLLNNFFLFLAMLGVFLLLGHHFSMAIVSLIPLTALVIIMAMGIGMVLGILNVFLRDIGLVVPILMQVWFWFTPIVYPENIIPESYRHLLKLNPMYSITNAYHEVLVYNRFPDFTMMIPIFIGSLAMLFLGFFLFRRASAEMVDVL